MTQNPIGWHKSGTGGHAQGLGQSISRQVEAGLRPVICCPEDAALAVEVGKAGGIAVYRKNAWSGAPDYAMAPDVAAAQRWTGIKAMLPPEIVDAREQVWIQFVIEPDRQHGEWVHWFSLYLCQLANADGYKVCGPNWSTGTPEVSAYESPGGLAFLRYLAQHRHEAALALHEYSLEADDIQAGYPWLVGRYRFVLDVCDDEGIGHPRIMITECGWTYNDMPEPEAALQQIIWLAEEYGHRPFCTWTLGQWQDGDLPQKLQKLIVPVTDYIVANYEPVTDNGGADMDWRKLVWEASIKEQIESGLSLNPEAGLQKLIFEREGYTPVHSESTVRDEAGQAYGFMAGEHVGGEGPRITLAFRKPWSGPAGVEVLTDPQQPLIQSPVGTLQERQSGQIWPGSWTDATPYGSFYRFGDDRQFSAYHTGADLNLNDPQWDADAGMPVHAVADGVVTFAQRVPAPSTWGRLVVVRHELPNGIVFDSRSAHMATMLVQEGQRVQRGDVLGTIGGDEFGLPIHLHFDLSQSGILASKPLDWPGMDRVQLLKDYVDPKLFLQNQGKVDPGEEPPLVIDLLPYLRGAHGHSHEMHYELDGQAGTHPLQIQHEGDEWYIVKGWSGEFERLYFDEGYIYRDLDTSEAPDKFYVQRTVVDGEELDGHPWSTRHMAVGGSFRRQPRVVHFWQDSCDVRHQGDPLSTLQLVAHAAELTFQKTGVTVQDVVILSWSGGERYYFARGESLVGFEVGAGWSYIGERHDRQLSRNMPPCYEPRPRYWR